MACPSSPFIIANARGGRRRTRKTQPTGCTNWIARGVATVSPWNANVDQHFAGDKADLAKIQATRIAGSIHRRLQGRSGNDFETLKTRAAEGAES